MADDSNKKNNKDKESNKNANLKEIEEIEDFEDIEDFDELEDFKDVVDKEYKDIDDDELNLEIDTELDDLFNHTKKLFKKIKNVSQTESRSKLEKVVLQQGKDGNSKPPDVQDYNIKLQISSLLIEELSNLGLDVSATKDMVDEAKILMDNDDFDTARNLIINSELLSNKLFLEHRVNLLSTIVSFIETFIFELTEQDLDFENAEEYFRKAKSALEDKNISLANKYLDETINSVLKTWNEARSTKLKEAFKFLDFWILEMQKSELDITKIKNHYEEAKNEYKSNKLDNSEQSLKFFINKLNTIIKKMDLSVDRKEDLLQELTGIYDFEDFISLGDAISRTKSMLIESYEKDKIQTIIALMIQVYRIVLGLEVEKKDVSKTKKLFFNAKDSFEKGDYTNTISILKDIEVQLKIPSEKPVLAKEVKTEPVLDEAAKSAVPEIQKALESKEKVPPSPERSAPSSKPPMVPKLDEKPKIETKQDLLQKPGSTQKLKSGGTTQVKSEPSLPIGQKESPIEEKPDQLESEVQAEKVIDITELKKIESDLTKAVKDLDILAKDGVDISNVQTKTKELRKCHDNNELENCRRLMDEIYDDISKLNAQRRIVQESKAKNLIKKLELDIELAKKDKAKTQAAEDLLYEAKQKIKNKKYLDVIKILEESRKTLEKCIKERFKEFAEERLDKASKTIIKLPPDHKKIPEIMEILKKAQREFDDESYRLSREYSDEVLTLMDSIEWKVENKKIEELVKKETKEKIVKVEPTNELKEKVDVGLDQNQLTSKVKIDDLKPQKELKNLLNEFDEPLKEEITPPIPEKTQKEDMKSKSLDIIQPENMEDTSTVHKLDKRIEPPILEKIEKPGSRAEDIEDIKVEAEVKKKEVLDIKPIEKKLEINVEVDDGVIEKDDKDKIVDKDEIEEQDDKEEQDEKEKLTEIEEEMKPDIETEVEFEKQTSDNFLSGVEVQDSDISNGSSSSDDLIKEAFGFVSKKRKEKADSKPIEINRNIEIEEDHKIQNKDPEFSKLDNSDRRIETESGFKDLKEHQRPIQGKGYIDDYPPLDGDKLISSDNDREYRKSIPDVGPEFSQLDRARDRPNNRTRSGREQLPSQNRYNSVESTPDRVLPSRMDGNYEREHVEMSSKNLGRDRIPPHKIPPRQIPQRQIPPRRGPPHSIPPPKRREEAQQRGMAIDRPPNFLTPNIERDIMEMNMQAEASKMAPNELELGGHDKAGDVYKTRLDTLKKDALSGLQEIQSIISETYHFGADINELERISEDARNAYEDGDYQEVLLYVDKTEELSRRLKITFMATMISEYKYSGENVEYLEYLLSETETAYNDERYKIGDELARRFMGTVTDIEQDRKVTSETWIYCRYCGNAIPSDSTFCSFCGEKLG